MKKKNNKKNTRKVSEKENKLKQKILEINLSKVTIITSIIAILVLALITAGIIKTINESNKEKVEVEQEEEYSPVNWIESTEVGEDGNYKKIPVPKGYVASQIEGETTVSGGFVIYEDNYNGKSINWDEIIIKEGTVPETPEVTPTEDVPEDEIAVAPENVEGEGRQEEQVGAVENNESPVSEESPEVEEGTNPEERAASEEPSQGENEVAPQADEATGEEGETTDPTEPETPATPTAEQQTKKNIYDLQRNVNQYVWVPVADISRMCGVDANGKMWGKLYQFTSSGASNPYVNGSSNYSWAEEEGKIVTPPSGKTKSGGWYREPDIVPYLGNSSYYMDQDIYLKRYMYGETRQEMLAEEMEQEFYETMKSIEKYGGYYIGRYETGGLSSSGMSAVVRKMDTSIASVTWYQMYKGCKGLVGDNNNVKTSMIWGSLWDETLKWLVESGAKTTGKEGVASQAITYSLITDSTKWGNYDNATFKYIPVGEEPEATAEKARGSTRIPTGSAEYTKVNNIYDMAGNVYDWTLEAWSTYSRVCRGGHYDYSGSNSPASYRNYDVPGIYNSVYGCRAALIISD